MELLDALLGHYKIDLEGPDKWMMLSLRLAMDHVPDFQREKAPRGRPATYRDPLAAALVERARFTQRTEISGAIRYVIETEPNFKFVTESALRKRWQRGLGSPWVKLAKAGAGPDWPWALVPALRKLEESSRKRGQKS
jgi:hypothetical protein